MLPAFIGSWKETMEGLPFQQAWILSGCSNLKTALCSIWKNAHFESADSASNSERQIRDSELKFHRGPEET